MNFARLRIFWSWGVFLFYSLGKTKGEIFLILSTQSDYFFSKFGDEKGREIISSAGFDAVDISLFHKLDESPFYMSGVVFENYARKIRQKAANCGVFFNQAHAPFPSYKADNEDYNTYIIPKIQRAIEVSGILGVKTVCVHPVTFRNNEQKQIEFNLDFYSRLAPIAKKSGVKIGVENMFWRDKTAGCIRPGVCGTSEQMIKLFDALDPDVFTCLVDVGHCGLAGEKPEDFIRAVGGKRLGALHVHDNNFKDDQHTAPFTRSINWNEVTKALADIDYSGQFTFEADNFFYTNMPEDFAVEGLKFLEKIGRQLISMIEAHKSAK